MADVEQHKRIARHFLLHSPPGEFNEVAKDVKLLSAEAAAVTADVKREYNLQQMVAAKAPDADYKVVVSTHNELDANTYVDARGKKALTFDHEAQAFTAAEPLAADKVVGEVEDLRAELDTALSAYAANEYSDAAVTVLGVKDEGGPAVRVLISAARLNLKNFWVGRWRGVFTVADGHVKGKLTVAVHYYEEGNVQLQATKEVDVQCGADAGAVAAAIGKAEAAFSAGLDASYRLMSDNALKTLRRKLPVTGTKFDFGSFSHSLASELSGKRG